MTDYKHTLNLPNTDFPMKANLAQREPQILARWAEMGLYEKLRTKFSEAPTYVLHDGPPYANGHLHMGHALNKILKDFIVKSKTFSGFNAPLVPGWDCHGLPIELNVEKKVGKAGLKISAGDFRQACRDYANTQIDIQKTEFKRLGVQADWENPYLTMAYSFEANIIRSLAKMIQRGHLEKGYKPVHWCLDCGSALAEAEVEYADKTSAAIDVRFKLKDPVSFLQNMGIHDSARLSVSIPIWTTTPWTLPANEAVALNAQVEYALVKTADEFLIIANALVPQVIQRYDIGQYDIVNVIKGQALEGVVLKHPFYEKTVPVILGDHVTVESGTGAVHTAPAHGQDDFIVAKNYQLPVINPVGDNGVYTSITPLVAGLHVSKANDEILKLLEQNHVLVHRNNLQHSYPHCWRHKTPLIFRATPQWFISMDKANLRAVALSAIDDVTWVPDWGKSRITSMVANRPDWCISRQRTWGVPIPLFIHKETGELHPETNDLIERIALMVETSGVEAWFDLNVASFLKEDADQYQKTTDILDVWLDSGVSHECVLRHYKGLSFPADLYLEGSDQHRGWFNSSLMTASAMNGQAPFKTVLTHGFVVDGQGRKMSKSIGNVIAPEEIIKTLGADVLRLWIASVDYRYEIGVSKEILTRASETYRRIRNTTRFFLANLAGFDPALHSVPSHDMVALDRWAVVKTCELQAEIIKLYEEFQFHAIYQKIQHFCINEMGGFYLDIIKDRQYTLPTNSRARRSAQTALFHIVEAFTRWIAPILSFTADEIWQFMPGTRNESVFLNTWYKGFQGIETQAGFDLAYWAQVRLVRDAVNQEIEAQRKIGSLGSALEAAVELHCDENIFKLLAPLQDELRFILITSRATCVLQTQSLDFIETEVAGLKIKVTALADAKCERCWHRCHEVGSIADHPTLCARCITNINEAGEGEQRLFA